MAEAIGASKLRHNNEKEVCAAIAETDIHIAKVRYRTGKAESAVARRKKDVYTCCCCHHLQVKRYIPHAATITARHHDAYGNNH